MTHEPGSESASINSPDYMVFIKGFEMLQYLLQTLCHDIGLNNFVLAEIPNTEQYIIIQKKFVQ